MSYSIIEYYSLHGSSKCGYCKRNTHTSHGLWAHRLTVTDYQDLIDRGWRRSGKYCYKPVLDEMCCPMYTIRCRALEFKTSKSQKKVLKKFNKYLIGQDELINEKRLSSMSCEDFPVDDEVREQFVESTRTPRQGIVTDADIPFIEDEIDSKNDGTATTTATSSETSKETKDEASTSAISSKTSKETEEEDKSTTEVDAVQENSAKRQCKVAGPDPTKAPCKKAKQIRRERMLEKLQNKGVDINSLDNSKNKEKQIEEFINELPDDVKRKLTIKLVRTAPASLEWLATSKQEHEVYIKYQTVIHGDKPTKCDMSQFHDFLVSSPLQEEHSESGPSCGYGSFHQQYWLDGKIIAVGVLDILPKCVSSVYFFYDPDYTNLTLGTYGALREIAFTRDLQKTCPNLKYYYMGYYIHSCRKMRYKGHFHPSDLLCPETYNWFNIKECIPKLEITPYSRLDPDVDNIDRDFPNSHDINNIPVLVNGEVMLYKSYRRKNNNRKEDVEELTGYARLVGVKVSRRLVMVK